MKDQLIDESPGKFDAAEPGKSCRHLLLKAFPIDGQDRTG